MPSNWIAGPLADKLGRIKPVMLGMVVIGHAMLLYAWVAPAGDLTLPLMVAGCLVSWGNIALIKGCVGLIPTIKPEHMGTAGGIQTFFQNLSAFVLPSFVIMPLCGGDMTLFFVILSIGVILAGVVMCVIPELGAKGNIHQENA